MNLNSINYYNKIIIPIKILSPCVKALYSLRGKSTPSSTDSRPHNPNWRGSMRCKEPIGPHTRPFIVSHSQ
jgi:hypothetical protein